MLLILYSEFCGSDQLWIDFTDPEQQALKIAKLPPCLWHICLAIIPLGWLIVALPFFISDIRKKKRKPLSVSWSYIVKAFASLAFIAAPVTGFHFCFLFKIKIMVQLLQAALKIQI